MIKEYFFVYILSNIRRTVFYVGVTDAHLRRVLEHKNKVNTKSFTARYNVDQLVYYEIFYDPVSAIKREKQLTAGKREDKLKLIEAKNPEFRDLSERLLSRSTHVKN